MTRPTDGRPEADARPLRGDGPTAASPRPTGDAEPSAAPDAVTTDQTAEANQPGAATVEHDFARPVDVTTADSHALARAWASATSSVVAGGTAVSRPTGAAVAGAPDGPGPGRRPPPARIEDLVGTGIRARRLTRLRIGWHAAPVPALAQLGVSLPGAGLILGLDRDQRPVSVRAFRPEPTRAALVGGTWAAQLVVFRALAVGAATVVMTAQPGAWHGFGERATGQADRVVVVPGERQLAMFGTDLQPAMIVYDLGASPAVMPSLGPWQTQLTVLRKLDESSAAFVRDCHWLIVRRLDAGEAALAASALLLPDGTGRALRSMPDREMALIGDSTERFVSIDPTALEQQHIATPVARHAH